MKNTVKMVSAVALNGGIGYSGNLLYRFREDLENFKHVTLGTVMVMGRKTYQSLPSLLPARHHVVLTSDPGIISTDRVTVCESIGDVFQKFPNSNLSIIGGSEIYRAFAPFADEILLTHIFEIPEHCDTFFPMEILSDFAPTSSRYLVPDKVLLVSYTKR